MKKIWVITRMTFFDAIQRRIVFVSILIGVIFLIIFAFGFNALYNRMTTRVGSINDYIAIEAVSILMLAGLYAITFLSAALGALLGADTLSGEITSGTIQTIASKPIRRSKIVIGKWFGYAILLALYSIAMTGGIFVSVWLKSRYVPDHIFIGQLLIYLESILVMTVAMMYSSFLPSLATGAIIFGLYGLAFIGGWIEQIGAILKIEESINLGVVVSLIIPSEALWRRASFEMQSSSASLTASPFAVVSVPSSLMIWYAIFYLLITLFFTIKIFEKRDL